MVLVCIGVFSLAGSAANASEEGLKLIERVHYRPDGIDQVSKTIMTLSGQGKPRERTLYIYRLDGKEKGDMATLLRFVEPAEISGTGLLTIDYSEQEDSDQWVFLPELRRERRISSSRKGGRFLGSDLYFEDLQDRDPEKDNHTILRTEMLSGRLSTVVESTPLKSNYSVYSKRVAWIDMESLIPVKMEYYVEGRKQPIKRWLVKDLQNIDGFWIGLDRTMIDLENNSATNMHDIKVKFNQGFDESLFKVRALKSDSRTEKKWRP